MLLTELKVDKEFYNPDHKECKIDPVVLGIKMAELDRDIAELRKETDKGISDIRRWQKKNWNYTKAIHKKVKVMSLVLRRHRLVFAGVWGFITLSALLLWELAKDWIKMKFHLIIGG